MHDEHGAESWTRRLKQIRAWISPSGVTVLLAIGVLFMGHGSLMHRLSTHGILSLSLVAFGTVLSVPRRAIMRRYGPREINDTKRAEIRQRAWLLGKIGVGFLVAEALVWGLWPGSRHSSVYGLVLWMLGFMGVFLVLGGVWITARPPSGRRD